MSGAFPGLVIEGTASAAAPDHDPAEVELSRIVRDPEIQPRETLDRDTVEQYAEAMLAGAAFPPVVIHDDGERLWLSQGFHRCAAAERAGWETIPAEVRRGKRRDALWDALGSNREHDTVGLRRSNADKRRAVLLALGAEPGLSNVAIARHVGVSDPFVMKLRKPLTVRASDGRRTGTDGKSYPATVARTPRLEHEAEADPDPGRSRHFDSDFERDDGVEPESGAGSPAVIPMATGLEPTPIAPEVVARNHEYVNGLKRALGLLRALPPSRRAEEVLLDPAFTNFTEVSHLYQEINAQVTLHYESLLRNDPANDPDYPDINGE